jgi:hypothetical protein
VGFLSRATTAHKLEEDLQKKQFVLVVPVKRVLVSVNVSLNFLLIVSFLVRQVESLFVCWTNEARRKTTGEGRCLRHTAVSEQTSYHLVVRQHRYY